MTDQSNPPRPEEVGPAAPADRLSAAYEYYFRSGAYDERYPVPNVNVLDRILALLPAGGHLIDYGCGSGRYLFPLRKKAGRAAGYDVSTAALDLLRSRAAEEDWPDLAILGPDPESLEAHKHRHGPADLVLCLFGVLGHIVDFDDRRAALRRMAGLLKPGTGRLILSVPNRWRRFYVEQMRAASDGQVAYKRLMNGASVDMHYQLFGPVRLRQELSDAGLCLESLSAESLFSESMIARSSAARAAENVMRPLLPAIAGYGLLAVAAATTEQAS